MISILFPPDASTADVVQAARICRISDPCLYVLSFDPSYAHECNQRILQAFGLNPKTVKHDVHSCFKLITNASSLDLQLKYPRQPIHPSHLFTQKSACPHYLSLVTDQSRLSLISALIQNCFQVPLCPDQSVSSFQYQPPLPGTFGWDSFNQLFSFLSQSVIWCLLRNYEYHANDSFWERDNDLDILSPKLDLLICACNATPRYGGISSFTTIVEGKELNLDLRSIGDKYYDPAWAIDILRTRVKTESSIYHPSTTHYLYMLIYHSLLQKSNLSDHYLQRISYLSADLCLDWDLHKLDQQQVSKYLLKLLDSFLSANNYVYTFTADAYINIPNVSQLGSIEVQYPGILFKPLIKRIFYALVYRLKWKLRHLFLTLMPSSCSLVKSKLLVNS